MHQISSMLSNQVIIDQIVLKIINFISDMCEIA
jgi:hypothetical protein